MSALRRRSRQVDQTLCVIAGLGLLGMMVLTSIDVVGRYFLGRPVHGAFELTEMLLVVVIFMALPSLSYGGGQIETDLFESVLPQRIWKLLYRVARLVTAVCLAFVAWQAWIKAGKIVDSGDTTSALRISLAPFAFLIAGMTGLASALELFRFVVPVDSTTTDDHHGAAEA